MANKVYNLAGGLHSAAAYAGWENELFGGNAVASPTALQVGAGSGMTVSVGKGNALIDTGDDYSRRVALTEAVNVTLDQADTSLPRNDLIVIYVDMAVSPVQTVQDNTNGILKVVAVKGTPASSPSDPDAGTIQQAIGAGNPYMTLASIRVNAGASAISSGNITDKRPASPNVYWTTSSIWSAIQSQVKSAAESAAKRLAPDWQKATNIKTNSYTPSQNGFIYVACILDTNVNNSTAEVTAGGTYIYHMQNARNDLTLYNTQHCATMPVAKGVRINFILQNGATWQARRFCPYMLTS